MDITVAYFHALLRPDVVKQDFEQIRAAGASSILYTIHEQEEQRWPRDFERGLRQAQDAGLKVHLGLGRFGNLFAGPTLAPSWYTFLHPQSRVKDQHGRYHELSCFNHQSFRSWLFREIERYLTNYPISGILLDEPRGLEVTCYCSACRALCPDVTDLARFRRRALIEFLSELCAYVKQVNGQVKTTIALHPQDISLVEDLVAIPHLDTLGGHLFWDLLQEDVSRVEQWGREIIKATRAAARRSQLWLQNFNIDAHNQADLETAFVHILGLEPDELGCYYFWRNNTDPLQVWDTTRKLLRRVPRRQLRWRMYTSSPLVNTLTSTLDGFGREQTVGSAASVLAAPSTEIRSADSLPGEGGEFGSTLDEPGSASNDPAE